MEELTILIPALNEEKTIEIVIKKAQKWLNDRNIDGEILIANNGSTDNTKEIVEDINKLKNKRQFKQYDDEHSFISFKDEEDLAIKAKNKTFNKYVKVIKDMNRPLDYLGYIKLLKARKFARCW